MARNRRRANARTRLNLEIVGLAAIALAVLCGIALAFPNHAGSIGGWGATKLRALFGDAAPLFPVLVALIGGIIFLEINVPRMIAGLGSSALAYFLIIDAFFGARSWKHGGVVGTNIWWALRALVGGVGATIVLSLAALSLTLWLTNASLKRLIGRAVVFLGNLRPPPRPRSEAISETVSPKLRPVVPEEAAPLALIEEEEPDEVPLPVVVAKPTVPPFVLRQAQDDRPRTIPESQMPTSSRAYRLPDLSLFDAPPAVAVDESSRAHVLEDTLASFGVGAKVAHIERGPSVTRYELKPERGVKISRIASLADDLALALAATSVRIEAPIPGKSAIGIEVPNKTVSIVAIREILDALPNRGQVPPLWMALGKDITGRPVFGDLCKMPHLLIAGATGAGKSVCLNTIVASLLVSATPDQVQMLMIDPKRVEFAVYDGIPHLIEQVITDPRLAAGALFQMTKEMDSRYERFARAGVRKIEEYNAKFPDETLPYVIILIDELADLMMIAPGKVETTICRIAQLARATGIHLVVATQRPSVDVITGIIKANIPSRIAFAVSSQVDSRTILDMAGAERLLGRGDMLYLPIDAPKPVRAQGALITGAEVSRLVAFWAAQGRPDNLLGVDVAPIEDDERSRNADPLAYDAARFIIETNYASTAQLQTRFSIGHPRAVRLMKFLEECGVVGQHEGPKPRRINVGLGELEALADRLGKRDDSQTDLFATGM